MSRNTVDFFGKGLWRSIQSVAEQAIPKLFETNPRMW